MANSINVEKGLFKKNVGGRGKWLNSIEWKRIYFQLEADESLLGCQ